MKKIIALLLTLVLVFGFAACGQDNNQAADNGATNEVAEKETEDKETTEDKTETKEPVTIGEKLQAEFKENSTGTAQEIADKLIAHAAVQPIGLMTVTVEAGYLNGFDNAEIKGFKEGIMFLPMIGSIAFVGYVFVLEDGADVEAFKTTLKDNANLRWNICVEAEELVVDNVGNTVFFVMCPKNIETPDSEEGGVGGMDMPVAGDEPAYDGEAIDTPAAEGGQIVGGEVTDGSVVEGEIIFDGGDTATDNASTATKVVVSE